MNQGLFFALQKSDFDERFNDFDFFQSSNHDSR